MVYLIADKIPLVKLPLLMIVDSLWVMKNYEAHLLKSLMTFIFYISLILVGDSIFLTGISAIMFLDVKPYLQNPYGYYFFAYVAKIVELLVIVVLKLGMSGMSKTQSATWRDWLRTMMYPVISVIIAILLMRVYTRSPDSAPQILICSIVLAVADILAIVLLNYLEQQQQKLNDYAIFKQASKQIQDSMDTWENAYNSQRRRTHEFQNHLAAIRGLAEREAPGGELVSYVERLLNEKKSYGLVVKTGRTAVDVVLSQKFGIAQSKGIELQFNLMNPADVMLPDEKFVLVLSNLLNNAIEACEKIPDPAQRKIWLTIQANAEVTFIIVRNTTAEPVRIWRGRVRTSKANAMAHGFGLQNINWILSQYGSSGVLTYDAETGIFAVSIQLIPQKE